MKVYIVSKKGFVMDRDFTKEVMRRMRERGASADAIETFRVAAKEFEDEYDAYAASIKER